MHMENPLFANAEELAAATKEAVERASIPGVSEEFGRGRGAFIRLLHPTSAIVAEDRGKAGALWHSELCQELPKPLVFVPLSMAEVRTHFEDGGVRCRSEGDVTTGRAVRGGETIDCPGRDCEFARVADGRRRCSLGLSVRAWLPDYNREDGGREIATIDFRGGSLAAGRKLVATLRTAGVPPYALAFALNATREKPRGGGAPFWAMTLDPWPDGGLGKRLSATVVVELAELTGANSACPF